LQEHFRAVMNEPKFQIRDVAFLFLRLMSDLQSPDKELFEAFPYLHVTFPKFIQSVELIASFFYTYFAEFSLFQLTSKHPVRLGELRLVSHDMDERYHRFSRRSGWDRR
jgi:hypothetical protein